MKNQKLYGTDGWGDNLYLINTTTGVGTLIGNMGGGRPKAGLAYDTTTDTMYVGTGMAVGMPELFTVDIKTAGTSLVGIMGDPSIINITGMDFDSSGMLYAGIATTFNPNSKGDSLFMIDKSNANTTFIGAFVNSDCISGLSFDASGNLWGVDSGAGGIYPTAALFTINTTNGLATHVIDITDQTGAPPTFLIKSLAFSYDGKLYAGTSDLSGPDGGRLIEINPVTGEYQFVGTGKAVMGDCLSGLEFVRKCRGLDVEY